MCGIDAYIAFMRLDNMTRMVTGTVSVSVCVSVLSLSLSLLVFCLVCFAAGFVLQKRERTVCGQNNTAWVLLTIIVRKGGRG